MPVRNTKCSRDLSIPRPVRKTKPEHRGAPPRFRVDINLCSSSFFSFVFFSFFEDYLLLGCFGTTRGGLWTTKTTRYLSLPPFGCLRSPPFTERSNFTLALYGGKWRNQRWRGCARVRRRAASCAASYSRSKNISLEDAAAGGAASCASKNYRGSCYAGQAMRLRSDQQRTTSNSFFFLTLSS